MIQKGRNFTKNERKYLFFTYNRSGVRMYIFFAVQGMRKWDSMAASTYVEAAKDHERM
jgi:hypothetical protein